MNIEITAFDTLFFKDGKPFTMGEDTWAAGIFPPYPSVLYGMLRTTFASQNNIPINLIEERTKNLVIKNIMLKSEDGYLLFPYPTDLFVTKSDQENVRFMNLIQNEIISNIDNHKFPYVLYTNTNEKIEDKFAKAYLVDFSFVEQYLSNKKTEKIHIKDSNDIFVSESKIGIAKELKSNQTSEGKLYRVGMTRTKVKFIIEFEGLELMDEGLLKLGAEGKAAYYKKTGRIDIAKPDINSQFVKLYLSTPAIFKGGAIPEFISKGNFEGIEVELLTMSIGKPLFIGGFDMKARKPKPMKKAVSAGSVYYLKTNNAKELVEKLHSKSISEINAEQGFGICYCGTYNFSEV